MATIKPFEAIRPNPDQLHPLQFLGEEVGVGMELDYLKYRLNSEYLSLKDCKRFFNSLLTHQSYVKENGLSIYIYQSSNEYNSYTGIWALTAVSDTVIPHEETLVAVKERLINYREQIGLEGSGIVLAYHDNAKIEALISSVKAKKKCNVYAYKGVVHKIWRISEVETIRDFQKAFAEIGTVFMVDGHHRWAAAQATKQKASTYISSVYIAVKDLCIQPFHKVLTVATHFNVARAMEIVGSYYYVSLISDLKAYRPDKKNRLGMCLNGTWYQLDVREGFMPDDCCDARFLQDKVLAPAFGIASPSTDKRLQSFPDDLWDKVLLEISKNEQVIVFTLCAININDLMQVVENGGVLPPKSTYILPKIPYGLLMYKHGA